MRKILILLLAVSVPIEAAAIEFFNSNILGMRLGEASEPLGETDYLL